MKLVWIHAALLLVALGVAYQTWTREEAAAAPGTVALWSASPDDVRSITYESEWVRTAIERRRDERGTYHWGMVTRRAPGAVPGEPEAVEEAARTAAFLVGEEGERLLRHASAPRALRGLGTVDAEREREYGLDGETARLTVELDRGARQLLVGGPTWGTEDRYVRDTSTGNVYVLSGELVRLLEDGDRILTERRLHAFGMDRVGSVRVQTPRGERVMRRVDATPAESPAWTAPDRPDQPDQTFANFMERLSQLWIMEYVADLDRQGGLTSVVRVEYLDPAGRELGFLELLRGGVGEEGPEYFVHTDHTRTAARVYHSVAEQVDQDVVQLF